MDPGLLSRLPATPASHHRLHLYAAVLALREQVAALVGADHELAAFLDGYASEVVDTASTPRETWAWWDTVAAWTADTAAHLPLRALAEAAGLDADALRTLATVGLPEEDLRFGTLFDGLQGGDGRRRPTVGLLEALAAAVGGQDGVRSSLDGLLRAGVVEVTNPDVPRPHWELRPVPELWPIIRGDPTGPATDGVRYVPSNELAPLDALVLADAVATDAARLPALLTSGEIRTVVVAGPRSSGRRTLVGAVARAMGHGLLVLDGVPDPDGWRRAGAACTLLRALPAVLVDPPPGEVVEVSPGEPDVGPLAVVAGRHGGVAAERAVSVHLQVPEPDERRRHWSAVLGVARSPSTDHPTLSHDPTAPPPPEPAANVTADVDDLADRFRMTAGNIRRTAALACAEAALDGGRVTAAAVTRASRSLHGHLLDTLATRLTVAGDWDDLAVTSETARELVLLEQRCRHRERLRALGPSGARGAATAGVRALLTGPSGTGKTMAARILASVLGKDLYRLDLAGVVNKYLGETEKNLAAVFARAEELDVVLLLDEGDALMTRRTDVHNANDRYANLETNFLLQRLETFEGILAVTTNAADRIDQAFRRRMDIVVEFRPPGIRERWSIWRLHLPDAHQVDDGALAVIAERCALTGGQISNAATHAALLALDDGGTVTSAHVTTAVQREYRKAGAVCPLRADGGHHAGGSHGG